MYTGTGAHEKKTKKEKTELTTLATMSSLKNKPSIAGWEFCQKLDKTNVFICISVLLYLILVYPPFSGTRKKVGCCLVSFSLDRERIIYTGMYHQEESDVVRGENGAIKGVEAGFVNRSEGSITNGT